MLKTARATRGMCVAPHHLAAQSGLGVLREGGHAVQAMVAAAATIAVVYPHMNALGGDGFWLIAEPGRTPIAIDACGPAARAASREFYRKHGCPTIPSRGPLAALTVAGTVSGWQTALAASAGWGRAMPLTRLLADAVHYARDGSAISTSQSALSAAKLPQLIDVPGFGETFLNAGQVPAEGERLRQPRLAATLERLAHAGLDDFYRGDLADSIAADLAAAGSPLRYGDLATYHAQTVEPLTLRLGGTRVWNLPPPTQGLASLLILGLFERLGVREAESFAHIHGLVEATKQAFLVRDRHITDPRWMTIDPQALLTDARLDALAAAIDRHHAAPWPRPALAGDTVWLGCIDSAGRAVSFIQSIYWEFGSGLVLPASGLLWQNRGTSFSLQSGDLQSLEPGRHPFHTLNPALARFDDGRVMVYGTMGGEGQPQTQAAVFSRYAHFGQSLQDAVSAPRWLLGRTWGDLDKTSLKLEARFPESLLERLRAAGHELEVVAPFDDAMGHAGALVRRPDGLIEGAADPRSDGLCAGF